MVENLIGHNLGQYRVDAYIDRGGMAFVYKAFQPSMKRFVALKVLPRDADVDQRQIERFRNEASTIANLEHPHILPVFDFGETQQYIYIVMRLVSSGTLQKLLRGVPLRLNQVQDMTSQIADALDYAHSKGVIHRDVKPSNILIDERGNCLLADFGISKIMQMAARMTGATGLGTPSYMSPEQARGRPLDARSDIYSLGVVTYQMATGRLPFNSDTPYAVLRMHEEDPVPAPRLYNPNLPAEVEQVILRTLAKSPLERYASAMDMAVALKSTLQASLASSRAAGASATQSASAEPAATVVFSTESAHESPPGADMLPNAQPQPNRNVPNVDMVDQIIDRRKMSYAERRLESAQAISDVVAQDEAALRKYRERREAEERRRQMEEEAAYQAEQERLQQKAIIIVIVLLVIVILIGVLALIMR